MPDRAKFWSPVPDWPRARLEQDGLGIVASFAEAAWLVSGDLPAFLHRNGGLACIGPREICAAVPYALRLAPDRLLFVQRGGGGVANSSFGWSDEGLAITDVSDGYVLFDITGSAASKLMALGAAYDFEGKPAGIAESASMLFAGLKTAVARMPSGWRLHVERPYATAMWQWLQHAAQEWAKPPA
ncbi:MAG TPA: sarcosine oxidase subunit gamma family protein [Dongiaceae bacterium]|jgi:heterotetrameric sarcosine oxidase gamma subunit|nr:sarcosine oxidase subunit gamma family protein [Dongiaceae bacterium]